MNGEKPDDGDVAAEDGEPEPDGGKEMWVLGVTITPCHASVKNREKRGKRLHCRRIPMPAIAFASFTKIH